jgi:ribose transport system substrate-binding protein
MRLRLLALVPAVLAVGGITSASVLGATVASGPITVAVMPKFTGVSYYEETDAGALCAAKSLKNVTVTVTGPTTSPSIPQQITDFKALISQKVNGIDFAATSATSLQSYAVQAQKAGISVVTFDSGITPAGTVANYATNNTKLGVNAADRMNTLLGPKGGQIGLLHFSPGSQTDNQRDGGFINELKKYPKIKIVATGVDNDAAPTALTVVSAMLTAHPQIKAIYAPDEEGVVGTAEAVKRANDVGKVKVMGWDAGPDTLAVLKQGLVQSLVVQNPFKMGYDSLIATVNEIRTGKTAPNEDTGATIVTKANLNTPAVQAVVNPSCATYKP